jgi:hypothetical protein
MGEAKKTEAVETFIRRWQGREGGQERANYVSFLNELIALLGLPPPDPADATHEHNDYVFERAIKKHKDEGDSHGRIDLYKKNSFVLEAKQSRLKGIKKVPGQNDLFTADIPEDSRGRRGADRAWDVLMLNAKRQAEEYARALPTSHGWPPFIAAAKSLQSSQGISHDGVKLHGSGFIVTPSEATHLGLGLRADLQSYVRDYRNGRDLAQRPRGRMVIDLFGLDVNQVRQRFPEIYQHLLVAVKPERDRNNRESYRTNWWIFGEPRRELRPALNGLTRYIATVDTARHRVFQFLSVDIVCDDKSVIIATDDAFHLGTLGSRIHVVYSLRAGGWLGAGNDAVYTKTRTFDPFPFPDANNIQKQTIRVIAEELDAHRKRVLAEHPHLTLTGLYNLLEMLRAGTKRDAMEEHDRKIFDDGLVLIMKELHDKLDIAVAEAYGWPADLSDDEFLARLVALNKERSAEEKRGLVRWLRPDYQIPRFAKGVDKQAAKEEGAQVAAELIAVVEQKPSFPSGAVEQTAAVFAALAAASEPLDAKGLAAQFKRTKTSEKKVGEVLASLARLGYVTSEDGKTFALRRVA